MGVRWQKCGQRRDQCVAGAFFPGQCSSIRVEQRRRARQLHVQGRRCLGAQGGGCYLVGSGGVIASPNGCTGWCRVKACPACPAVWPVPPVLICPSAVVFFLLAVRVVVGNGQR